MKRRHVLVGGAAVVAGALAGPSPGLAAGLPAAPDLVRDPAQADRDFVRWLSVHDPRASVRDAAAAAMDSGTTAFIASGYTAAVDQAARNRAEDLEFAERTAAGHPAQFFPWVDAAARRAVLGTDDELAEFADTGYAAARANDDAHIPYDGGAALVTPEERDFVGGIGAVDPGSATRRRAEFVETEADVAEFLLHGWPSAGLIDRDDFRTLYVADEWSKWRQVRSETQFAVTVDRAAREGTADPGLALQAWDRVRARSGRQPQGWTDRRRFALTRMDVWTRVSYLAADATNPLWTSLVSAAPDLRRKWTSEVNDTVARSDWWSQLAQYAQAAIDEWIYGS